MVNFKTSHLQHFHFCTSERITHKVPIMAASNSLTPLAASNSHHDRSVRSYTLQLVLAGDTLRPGLTTKDPHMAVSWSDGYRLWTNSGNWTKNAPFGHLGRIQLRPQIAACKTSTFVCTCSCLHIWPPRVTCGSVV